jgi:hypothetical protein
MKAVSDLLPLAIVVAAISGLTWFLLDRNVGPGKWLLAGLLFAHGWVHVMFLFPRPEVGAAGGPTWPFDMGDSWLITNVGLDPGLVRALGTAIIAAVLVGFALAALATIGFLVPSAWWSGLVLASAGGSLVLLTLFFSPTLLIGVAIDAALLAFVYASVWSPSASPLGGG